MKNKSNLTISELASNCPNFSIIIGIDDLRLWHREVIENTRRELEEIVLSDKAETYPTIKQAMEILHVDYTTLWRWDKKGYLKKIEFGGGRRYKMSDIKAILNGGKVQPEAAQLSTNKKRRI